MYLSWPEVVFFGEFVVLVLGVLLLATVLYGIREESERSKRLSGESRPWKESP